MGFYPHYRANHPAIRREKEEPLSERKQSIHILGRSSASSSGKVKQFHRVGERDTDTERIRKFDCDKHMEHE